jgi:integrase/recombinase XerD
VTRLRKMMLEELQRRNYSEITTRKYLQYVTAFARHFGKSPISWGRMSCEAIKPTCSKSAR